MKIALIFLFALTVSAQTVSKVWVPDNGDGTYKNPVIHADYSDPDAVRVGEDFYMTASSFNAAPGLPILHSKDLVNWRIVNHVFTGQEPKDVFSKPQHGGGPTGCSRWSSPRGSKTSGTCLISYCKNSRQRNLPLRQK